MYIYELNVYVCQTCTCKPAMYFEKTVRFGNLHKAAPRVGSVIKYICLFRYLHETMSVFRFICAFEEFKRRRHANV